MTIDNTKMPEPMSKKEMIDTLKGLVFGTFDRTTAKEREALEMAIKALEQQSCEDAVSREEVLKAMCDKCPMYNCVTGCSSYRHIEKMPSVTPKARWIPVSERLPEEHEWVGTKTFGTTISDKVYVTFESPKGERFTKHLSFQNGKVSNFVQREIDALYKGSVPIAWMPLPQPYKEDE